MTDPLLFTPGPLTTSTAVKNAMTHDYGSRDPRFMAMIASVRSRLLKAAGVSEATHACVLVPGSGTYAVEAVIGSAVPKNGGRLLILANGAYGKRIGDMARVYGIPHTLVSKSDKVAVSVADLQQALASSDSPYSHVAVIHHETTAGILNPVYEIGAYLATHAPSTRLIVDSMSAFGAYEGDVTRMNAAFLVSSSNKCIEGVPGFAFVIAERQALTTCEGNARSLALDLFAQWRGLEQSGQFRFTPPVQVVAAFNEALTEWEAEGGWQGRGGRYRSNYETICQGLEALGFGYYVEDPEIRGHIITTFMEPVNTKNWNFQKFYDLLAADGFVIYPGKLAEGASFRLGSIGKIFPKDCLALVASITRCLDTLGVQTPVQYA